jgi:hypothetical protein
MPSGVLIIIAFIVLALNGCMASYLISIWLLNLAKVSIQTVYNSFNDCYSLGLFILMIPYEEIIKGGKATEIHVSVFGVSRLNLII